MREGIPRTIRLEDYTPSPFLVDAIDLYVDLHEDRADVRARLAVRRNREASEATDELVLNGEHQELLAVALDGRTLGPEAYTVDDGSLRVPGVPDTFELTVDSRNRPQDNTALEGLYRSRGDFFTQCEAEGFRRITYFPDRPDVLARFTTTIEADRERFPVLLSNGNPVGREHLESGRHRVTWEDPYPKPCYLFALVAGDLACLQDSFTTHSGRTVPLELYVRHGDEARGGHALGALQRAMRWDEETFGLEYDLDLYMLVAVDDFNMGAMENKGLNIFNAQYVLASAETATDRDFENVESIVAHEYFHNWTGNRVTCRDWFQLSLKEGLTVFRERTFADDMHSAAVNRIRQVQALRAIQFPEDAGPMAHPVRPDSYIEINNFYTATVHEKGAEVIRMLHALLGREGFVRGIARYIEDNDGRAATIEDFVAALAQANDRDFGQFMRWYSQAGTPQVTARGEHDPEAGVYRLTLSQHCPPTPGQTTKEPFHIPIATALLGRDGKPVPLRLEGEDEACEATERVLELTEPEQTFELVGIREEPLPSLLRDFSAPIKLDAGLSDAELRFQLAHDDDPFNRWEAGNRLATAELLRWAEALQQGDEPRASDELVGTFEAVLTDAASDPAMRAEALRLPDFDYLAELMEPVDPQALDAARQGLREQIANALSDRLMAVYWDCQPHGAYRFEASDVARRSLAGVCLSYLMVAEAAREEAVASAERLFARADNMTDTLTALGALTENGSPEGERALASFHDRWQGHPLVLDKWLRIQAVSRRPDALERVRALRRDPAFDLRNPNRVMALVGAFSRGNPARFHDREGGGYRFVTDVVLELLHANPSLAARLLGALQNWRRFAEPWRTEMRGQLERVAAEKDLPSDVYEVVDKSLAEPGGASAG